MNNERVVLIVDDNSNNLKILAELISELNYVPAMAMSGKEALNYLEEEKPDLILLDVMMPELDGFEVCKIIKKDEKTKEIPIIFITAKNDQESEITALEIGGSDFITKPFSSEVVKARVKNLMELQISKDELNNRIKELVDVNDEKDTFLGILAHDLKNPFFGIIGLLELLTIRGESLEKEKILDQTNRVFDLMKRLYGMFEELLDWVNLRRGLYVPKDEILNVEDVLEEIIELYKPKASNKNIEIYYSIENNLKINFDRKMFSMVFRNLLDNSIKFTKAYGEIKFEGFKQGENVYLSITDTGIGMSGDAIKKAFSLSNHESTLGTKGEKGTGLGLLIIKEISNIEGITMDVKSEIGKGTTITMEFVNINENNLKINKNEKEEDKKVESLR